MKGNWKHGATHSRLYECWKHMKQRCLNTASPDYPAYGGRGISIQVAWLEFPPFAEWASVNGYHDSLTLDRRDNNGDYEPKNCYWATAKEQSNNTRRNLNLSAFGETKTVAAWVSDPRCVVKAAALYYRANAGWPDEVAITSKSRQS